MNFLHRSNLWSKHKGKWELNGSVNCPISPFKEVTVPPHLQYNAPLCGLQSCNNTNTQKFKNCGCFFFFLNTVRSSSETGNTHTATPNMAKCLAVLADVIHSLSSQKGHESVTAGGAKFPFNFLDQFLSITPALTLKLFTICYFKPSSWLIQAFLLVGERLEWVKPFTTECKERGLWDSLLSDPSSLHKVNLILIFSSSDSLIGSSWAVLSPPDTHRMDWRLFFKASQHHWIVCQYVNSRF